MLMCKIKNINIEIKNIKYKIKYINKTKLLI